MPYTAIVRYPKDPDMTNEYFEAIWKGDAVKAALSRSASNCRRTLEVIDGDGRTVEGLAILRDGKTLPIDWCKRATGYSA
jgi:hypothetical protein